MCVREKPLYCKEFKSKLKFQPDVGPVCISFRVPAGRGGLLGTVQGSPKSYLPLGYNGVQSSEVETRPNQSGGET